MCVCNVMFVSRRNTIEYPRFVSDSEHYLVFHRAASPQAKKKVHLKWFLLGCLGGSVETREWWNRY